MRPWPMVSSDGGHGEGGPHRTHSRDGAHGRGNGGCLKFVKKSLIDREVHVTQAAHAQGGNHVIHCHRAHNVGVKERSGRLTKLLVLLCGQGRGDDLEELVSVLQKSDNVT